jgi:uncharacterized SAM-binding protein YcdF (DUF218 family)
MARRSRPFRLPWLRLLLVGLLALAAIDFFRFRERVNTLPATTTGTADGIVVLTGGTGLRIAEALRLLGAGHAPRVLITGVNRDVTGEEVAARIGGAPDLYACCVDFGYEALTTRGNAREAAGWAREHGYRSLLLVTSDFHTPRSLLLFRGEMPDIDLTAVPVRTRIDPDRVFSDPRSLRGLVTEWVKWRVTQLDRLAR